MSATESGVKGGQGQEDSIQAWFETGVQALIQMRNPDRATLLEEFKKSIASFKDGIPFQISVLKPASFKQFLEMEVRTQPMLNQLASETHWWVLLDQIEESCFLRPDKLAIARQFLVHLYPGEIAEKPFQPPKNWQYLPVPEAVERFRKIFGSSLKADSVFKRARDTEPRTDSEGFLTAVKLTTLARLFGVEGNPLENTPMGLVAYAGVVNEFIPKAGQAYVKALGKEFSFANWREGVLTAQHITLTPAGRQTWQELESQSDDDFVIAPAVSGALYAGYSQHKARLAITAPGDRMPQDCIMTGGTLAVQPDRLCEAEHLRPDNPGNAYSPGAGGGDWRCVYWHFHADARRLAFGRGNAGRAHRGFGSAVLLRP